MTEATQARAAALKGVFSDFKLVKTRGVAQFIIEMPIEKGMEALVALGGIPIPKAESWVAVARLDETVVGDDEAPVKPKRDWGDVPIVEQAGIACRNPEFQEWMLYNIGEKSWMPTTDHSDSTARWVRNRCGIDSRKELATNTVAADKWRKLYQEFDDSRGTEER